MEIRVDCYSGYRGEETPRRLIFGKRLITVTTILDRWLAPDHRYFKIMGEDGGRYIIRHSPYERSWQLISYRDGSNRAQLPFSDFPTDPSTSC